MKIRLYQLFLRTYRWTKCRAGGSYDENGSGKFNDITPEVLSKLASDMAIDAVWYTGILRHGTKATFGEIEGDNPAIVKGEAGSPYAVKDYFDVAPELACNISERMQEFEALVKRTHDAGMKVIIDFIPNHVFREYKSENHDSLNRTNFYSLNGPLQLPNEIEGASSYIENPAYATGNDCFSCTPGVTDWYDTIKINYENAYSWNKMLEALLFWTGKGVDGFRCDMVEMVPLDFLRWAIANVRKHKSDILFIAEIYNKANYKPYIEAGFDYLYDKSGFYDALRAVSAGFRPAYWLTDEWQFLGDMQPRMLNFLENHDEQRLASDFFLKDPKKAVAPMTVSLLFNTAAFMLYGGQEWGENGMEIEGYSGADGRSSIFDFSSLHAKNRQIYKIYKELMQISADPIFSEGETYDLTFVNKDNTDFSSAEQFAFMRGHNGRMALVVANFSDMPVTVKVNIPDDAYRYFGCEKCTKFAAEISIAANGNAIIFS
ncbi:MAG: alpha-amylase [Bacteroidales bacterium]|nr:alpha-amylase [Bacteroidales bacterium]